MKTQIRSFLILSLPVLILGCAASKPREKETETKSAVRAAEELGADGSPQAALYLDLAKQQIATAEKQMKEGNQEQAARTLDRAKADAELAIALAKAADERASADETAARVEQLQKGL